MSDRADAGGISFGVHPAPITPPFEELVERTRRAEAMGFDSVWVPDQTPMAYPKTIRYESWTLLAALARETSRVRLGSMVTQVALRHPLLLAMLVSNVDHASDGRVTLGIGVGGDSADLAGLGEEALRSADLVDRLEEQVTIVDALLRGEQVTRTGGAYRMRDAVVEAPIQRPRPPITIAAQSPRTLTIAARHADTWNTLGGQPLDGDRLALDEAVATTRGYVDRLEAACAAAGRDPATLRRSVFAWRANAFRSEDAFNEWVGRYRDLGFSEFVFWWPSRPDRAAVFERVASDVMPQLKRG
jgi:alkanesulfonate monooxygenase SsuD/methylene tetrahydromethanopterin reductase-like flavin-dependent oxidoreductase (luciferase family)